MKNKCIYYDPDCMMCTWYTSAMVKHGVLSEEGRKAYQDLKKEDGFWIDINRARNEIALVDMKQGSVRYGVDSFLCLFASRWPSLAPLFQSRTLRKIALPIYRFISYNRKVISPPPVFEEAGSCTPDLHVAYRWSYILLTWFITSVILTTFSFLLQPIIPETSVVREFAICGGQILFQFAILKAIRADKIIHYLGNMMTVSVLGAMGLVPFILLAQVLEVSSLLALIVFGMTVFVMFLEHLRRVKYLQLPWFITLTWIIYRLLVLLILI